MNSSWSVKVFWVKFVNTIHIQSHCRSLGFLKKYITWPGKSAIFYVLGGWQYSRKAEKTNGESLSSLWLFIKKLWPKNLQKSASFGNSWFLEVYLAIIRVVQFSPLVLYFWYTSFDIYKPNIGAIFFLPTLYGGWKTKI